MPSGVRWMELLLEPTDQAAPLMGHSRAGTRSLLERAFAMCAERAFPVNAALCELGDAVVTDVRNSLGNTQAPGCGPNSQLERPTRAERDGRIGHLTLRICKQLQKQEPVVLVSIRELLPLWKNPQEPPVIALGHALKLDSDACLFYVEWYEAQRIRHNAHELRCLRAMSGLHPHPASEQEPGGAGVDVAAVGSKERARHTAALDGHRCPRTYRPPWRRARLGVLSSPSNPGAGNAPPGNRIGATIEVLQKVARSAVMTSGPEGHRYGGGNAATKGLCWTRASATPLSRSKCGSPSIVGHHGAAMGPGWLYGCWLRASRCGSRCLSCPKRRCCATVPGAFRMWLISSFTAPGSSEHGRNGECLVHPDAHWLPSPATC